MKARLFLIPSVTCNVLMLLLGACLWHFGAPLPVPKPPVSGGSGSVRPAELSPPEAAVPPQKPAPAFHWSSIESEDFEVYVKNLRAIGCPETVVRSIIEPELREIFEQRVLAMLAPLQPQFWGILSKSSSFEKLVDEKETELNEMDSEFRELLERLLGRAELAMQEFENSRLRNMPNQGRLLDFLPQAKRQAWFGVEREYAVRQEQLMEHRDDEGLSGKWDLMQKQRKTALEALLSAEELAEWKLRSSPAASIRLNLPGFCVTEPELKSLISLEARYLSAFSTSAPQRADVSSLEEEKRRELLGLLGDENFALYERARDSRFSELCWVAQRFELPAGTAEQFYEIRKAAEAGAEELRRNSSISAEFRGLGLAAIRKETEQALSHEMGEQVFSVYQEKCDWLSALESAQ